VNRVARGRAVLFNGPGQPFVDAEYPIPDSIGPEEILVRNRLATVCGSDLHTVRGRRSFATPSILGHEVVGEVVALGTGVRTDTAGNTLSTGDRVVWSIAASCGSCYYCRVADLPQKCVSLFKYGHGTCETPPHFNGGFADYTVLRRGTAVFVVPPSIDDREAAPISCAAATVVAAYDTLRSRSLEHVVIIGGGMLGTYATMIARDHHARSVSVLDLIPQRLEVVRRFGADRSVLWNPEHRDTARSELVEATDGFGADVVIEASGDPSMISWAVELLRPGGQLILLGNVFPKSVASLDAYDLIRKSISIIGSHNYRPDHLLRALRFIERHRTAFPLADLVPVVGELSAQTVQKALLKLESGAALRPAITISG